MPVRGSLVLIGVFFLLAQVLVLPPQGWMTGDQGSKYLQARAFAAHGPLNPAIEVLARDIDPKYVRQEPKLKTRRGRLVSEFLWLLPLVSAPFLRLLGLRGLYVVPALSVMAIFLVSAALGRRLGDDRGVRTAWIVLLVTPIGLYGLEFWEHAPAAACVLVAAALLFPQGAELWTAGQGRAGPDGAPPTRGGIGIAIRLAGAGASIALGALFREEVIAALPAFLIARGLAVPGRGLKTMIAAGFWMAVGAGSVLAAAVPMNLIIYGAPLPMHMTQDAWEVARSAPYLAVRRDVIVNLFLPARGVPVYVGAVMTGLAAASVQVWRLHSRRGSHDDGASRALLVVVHLAVMVAVGVAVGLPIWRKIHGLRQQDAFNATSAAHTWPFWLALLYAPWYLAEAYRPAARFLIVSAVLLLAGILLLIPTDGGAQYSPRFLLAVAPLLAVLAAAGVGAGPRSLLVQAGGASDRWPRQVTAGVGAVLMASMLMQLAGMVLVRRAKIEMARLTASVGLRTAHDDVLISNVFWFPEVTATLAPVRRMLFSWSSADVPVMAAMAVSRGFRRFSVVTSVLLTGYEAPPVLDVPGAPCRFRRGPPIDLHFDLILSPYACDGP